MKLLIIGSSYDKRNTNLSDATAYAISKGHEVISINGFRFEKNWKGKSDFVFYTEINAFVDFAITMDIEKVICLTTQNSLDRDGKLKKAFELNGIEVITNSMEVIDTFKNKSNTREFFREIGVNMAPGISLGKNANEDSLISAARNLKMPVVIKEAESTGGLGVNYINTELELTSFVEELDSSTEYVVEKFVKGIELSMEVICYQNTYVCNPLIYKGHTNKGTHSLDNIRITPFNNSKAIRYAQEVVTKVMENIKPSGILEFDMVWDSDSENLFVLEVNARMGGISKLDMESTGVNIPKSMVDMADGSWKPEVYTHNDKLTIEIPLIADINEENLKQVDELCTYRWMIQRPRKNSFGMICFSGIKTEVIEDLKLFAPNLMHEIEDIIVNINTCNKDVVASR